MFEHLFNRLPAVVEEPWFPHLPAVETEEKEKAFVVRMELPTFMPEEVSVEVADGWLLVEARHDAAMDDESVGMQRVSRRVDLPPTIAVDAVTATFRRGVLEVTLPKTEERPRIRRVEVRA